jgi:hypothetical protein
MGHGGHFNRAARRSGGSRAERIFVPPALPQGRFIVKVQISLATSFMAKQVLVYNKDRSLRWQGNASEEVLRLMGDLPKAFFWATVEGTEFMIQDVAPFQDW